MHGQAVEHGVEDRAADVVEVDVDPVGAQLLEPGPDVVGAVVDGAVEAEVVDQPAGLVAGAADADRPGSPWILAIWAASEPVAPAAADTTTVSPSSASADVDHADVGGEPGGAVDRRAWPGRRPRGPEVGGQRVVAHDAVALPAGQAVDDVAERERVAAGGDHPADAAGPHRPRRSRPRAGSPRPWTARCGRWRRCRSTRPRSAPRRRRARAAARRPRARRRRGAAARRAGAAARPARWWSASRSMAVSSSTAGTLSDAASGVLRHRSSPGAHQPPRWTTASPAAAPGAPADRPAGPVVGGRPAQRHRAQRPPAPRDAEGGEGRGLVLEQAVEQGAQARRRPPPAAAPGPPCPRRPTSTARARRRRPAPRPVAALSSSA